MSVEYLLEIREKAKVSDADLAKRMGVSDEEFEALVAGRMRFGRLHAHGLDRAALSIALDRRDPSLLNPQFLWHVMRMAILVLQGNRPGVDQAAAAE